MYTVYSIWRCRLIKNIQQFLINKTNSAHNNKYDIYMHHCTNAATSHVFNIPVSEIRYSTNTSDQSRVKQANYFNKSAIIKPKFRSLSPGSNQFYETQQVHVLLYKCTSNGYRVVLTYFVDRRPSTWLTRTEMATLTRTTSWKWWRH